MRDKKVSSLIEDLSRKTKDIMDDFSDFTSGTRVLLLLQRAKEGGHNKEHHRRRARFVTHDLDQFKRSLFELLLLQAVMITEYRVYVSVSPRDIQKAEKEFKKSMLDADFSEGEGKEIFYERFEDKWISALMASNPMKDTGLFILDIDDRSKMEDALRWVANNEVEIIKQYATKNGWHIVTKPFDRTLFPKEIGEVKVDGLVLLSY